MSSPLDASSDIDSDTLAAASAASAYDVAGRAMGTDQVVVHGDAAGPTMSSMDSVHQETGVSSDSDLTFSRNRRGRRLDDSPDRPHGRQGLLRDVHGC